MFPDIKLNYKSTVIQTAWHWHKSRHVDQWNRIESPEINPSVKSDLCLTTHKKSSKWVSDLNVRVTNKTVELPGGDIEVSFHSLRLDSSFLDMTPKSQVTKENQINWLRF